ncbi:MAG: DNA recombination protein RmuC, partial [Terriglobales bacterium]
EEKLLSILPREFKLAGAETVKEVKTTQAAMQSEVGEMRRQLEAYQVRITEFEKQRAGEQAQLQAQLETVIGAGAAMGQEARALRDALTTNAGVRGAWGERTIKNILDACGLNQQIDYELQVTLPGGGRPDAVVHLPGGSRLVIDSKASLANFLDGLEAADDEQRRHCYAEFAKVLRQRARELAGKEYSLNLENSLRGMVMFVPSEGAFRAALDADADLFRYGQSLTPPVLLASPSTLFPLLLVVAHGWQQHKAGHQMQLLLDEVRVFGSRVETLIGHFQAVGRGLDAAGKAFNSAVASHRTRLLPQAQKLEQLSAGWNELADLKPVENLPLGDSAAEATAPEAPGRPAASSPG